MSDKSRFGACPAQVHFRLSQLAALLQSVQPLLSGADESQKQLLLQMLTVQIHAYFEAYYGCVVAVATFWDPQRTRDYLAIRRPEQADNVVGLQVGPLTHWAMSEIAFKDHCKPLKSLVQALFGVELFPDQGTEDVCLDLIAVRNIVVHQVDVVGEADLPAVKAKDVIIETGSAGALKFYRLRLPADFVIRSLRAVHAAITHLQAAVDVDPRFALPKI